MWEFCVIALQAKTAEDFNNNPVQKSPIYHLSSQATLIYHAAQKRVHSKIQH